MNVDLNSPALVEPVSNFLYSSIVVERSVKVMQWRHPVHFLVARVNELSLLSLLGGYCLHCCLRQLHVLAISVLRGFSVVEGVNAHELVSKGNSEGHDLVEPVEVDVGVAGGFVQVHFKATGQQVP